MRRLGLTQVALQATDLDRAARFYTDLLGAGPIGRFEPPGFLFFQVGDTRLLLEANAPSSLIYLEVEDIHGTVERLREEGVVIESDPRVIFRHQDDSLGPPGLDEWQAFIRDSEGNLVGLVEQR